MTVAELIEQLERFRPDAEVCVTPVGSDVSSVVVELVFDDNFDITTVR